MKLGNVTNEMMYAAVENQDMNFFEDIKREGPVFGIFFSKES